MNNLTRKKFIRTIFHSKQFNIHQGYLKQLTIPSTIEIFTPICPGQKSDFGQPKNQKPINFPKTPKRVTKNFKVEKGTQKKILYCIIF